MKLNNGIKDIADKIFLLEYDEIGKQSVSKVLLDYKDTLVVSLTDLTEKGKDAVKGTNLYTRFALGKAYSELSEVNVRPINFRESEMGLKYGVFTEPTEIMENLGLAVFPEKTLLPILWESLRNQVAHHFKDVDMKEPFVITGLIDLVKDDKFEYCIRLDVNDFTDVYNVPILETSGLFRGDNPGLIKTGFPNKLITSDLSKKEDEKDSNKRKLSVNANGVRVIYRSNLDNSLYGMGVYIPQSIPRSRIHLINTKAV